MIEVKVKIVNLKTNSIQIARNKLEIKLGAQNNEGCTEEVLSWVWIKIINIKLKLIILTL